MDVGCGSVYRDERFNALSNLDSSCGSDGSATSPDPDAEMAPPGGGLRPLRKLKRAWRPEAYRTSLCTGSSPTASSCAIKGCGRLPRILYTDRRTKVRSAVCCLDCCYNVRDEEDVKVHTTECDEALEPAPGAHRENDVTAAMWHRPWGWTARSGVSPQWKNRHLTETEQSTASSFPIVTGDGAMRMEDAEFVDAFKPAVRPFDLDDADDLGVHPTALQVLNDFVFYVVHRNVSSSDELYGDPTPETRLNV